MTTAEPVTAGTQSSSPPQFCPTGRAAGAELIRQLSTLKLGYCQSNESLHHYPPIIKRLSENNHERSNNPAAQSNKPPSGVIVRPKLIRQQTANADTTTHNSSNRGPKLGQIGQKWSSCDVETYRRRKNSRGDRNSRKSSPGSSPRPASSSVSIEPSSPSIGENNVFPLLESANATAVALVMSLPAPAVQKSPTSSSFKTADATSEKASMKVRYQKESDQVILPVTVQASPSIKKTVQLDSRKPSLVVVVAATPSPSSHYPADAESGKSTAIVFSPPPSPRRARGIVILTSVVLIFTCVFLVGFTLRLAPLIDELGKYILSKFDLKPKGFSWKRRDGVFM